MSMHSLRLSTFIILLALMLLTALTAGCMRSLPYADGQVAAFHARAENIRLEFVTQSGRQVAFYIPPLRAPARPPQRINILYPGINSVALDWQQYIDLTLDPDAAYLLIDYPGRGFCEGSMRPEKNYLNSAGALEALVENFGETELHAELSLLGHSFGSGAALQFAERVPVARIVLVAPFSDLKAAVALQSWFLSIIMPSQIDNREIIRNLLQTGQPPQITILHGALDKVLPVSMGRELAAVDPELIGYYEFAESGHVDLLSTRRELIFSILNDKPD